MSRAKVIPACSFIETPQSKMMKTVSTGELIKKTKSYFETPLGRSIPILSRTQPIPSKVFTLAGKCSRAPQGRNGARKKGYRGSSGVPRRNLRQRQWHSLPRSVHTSK